MPLQPIPKYLSDGHSTVQLGKTHTQMSGAGVQHVATMSGRLEPVVDSQLSDLIDVVTGGLKDVFGDQSWVGTGLTDTILRIAPSRSW